MVSQLERSITTLLRVPGDKEFESQATEFLLAADVEQLAGDLIELCPELRKLEEASIGYCWKRKGGESGGSSVFGKCTKPSGLLAFYTERHFIIWLAADHCREWEFGDRELEALIYHELCHAELTEDEDTGQMKAKTLAHEVEMFVSELELYGLWHDSLKRAKYGFDQVELPGFGT